jgi:hypothetical protein
MVAGLRSFAKAMESPPEPNGHAPVPDPTREGLGVKFPGATRPGVSFNCSRVPSRFGLILS